MKERPILFCTSLVPEILADRKTVTRRIVKSLPAGAERATLDDWRRGKANPRMADPGPSLFLFRRPVSEDERDGRGLPSGVFGRRCPYGVPGDRLWVRETWADCRGMGFDFRFSYKADCLDKNGVESGDGLRARLDYGVKWRPSIHMPREACRLVLDVLSVRVERLQDITAEDVQAEGIKLPATDHGCPPGKVTPLIRIGSPYLKSHPDARHWTEEDFWRSQFACTWDDINAKRAPWSSNPWVWRIEFRRVET
jgi:hypothetical protein